MRKAGVLLISIIMLFALFSSGCNLFRANLTPANVSDNKVLNLLDSDPLTLDPAVANELGSIQYIMQIYSGLLKMGDDLQPEGDIAQSWDVSTDGLDYIFHIRRDVRFQNGKAVTATDFKYSWERAMSPVTKSLSAATYMGDIVGVKEMLDGKSNQISGVKVLDDYTLQVTIDSPKSYFLFKMTFPPFFVVDKNNVSTDSSWWRKPNGTGPFKLGEWAQNKSLTLVSNPYYYGLKPQLNQVKYQFYTGLPMDLYETGAIDISGASLSYIDTVLDKSGPYYQDLSITPEFSLYYVGFNSAAPPFDDANIRRAFSMAIDKEKIVKLIFRDMVQQAQGILPQGIPGYNPNVVGIKFDIEQARQLIKASKYQDAANLPPIKLTTSGYGGSVDITLQNLVYQWKQNLGVEVNIRKLEPEWFSYNTASEIDQMFDLSWAADYPHPQDFLDILFSSDSHYNYGRYSNPDVDRLIQQGNSEASDSKRSYSFYAQAEQRIIDDAACIPLLFGKNYLLTKPYVKDYNVNPMGFVNLNRVYIVPHQ